MCAHRLERRHVREALAHVEIVEGHENGIPDRLARKQATIHPRVSIAARARLDMDGKHGSPWISQQRLPDHDAVRASVGRVLLNVRNRPYVAVADDGDRERLFELAYGVEIGCALASPFGRYVACVQGDPRCARVFEQTTKFRRLG